MRATAVTDTISKINLGAFKNISLKKSVFLILIKLSLKNLKKSFLLIKF